MPEWSILIGEGDPGNGVSLWKKEKKIAGDMKHGDRILAIETAPEGDVIVSAGADELLKFW